ncbi:phosphotransferase family protein [Kribbella sp. NPDC059898]|uniref:phosphotransferase family protein n=1 Tax=Kribbella sp. NPDC059898 TaxID=3346995 RepID=UPI003651F9FF
MGEQDDFLGQVATVARRHGVGPGEVREVPGGVANRGFVLGEQLFLRVSRPGYEDDLRKEIHVVPAARSVGVLTPAIVEYDAGRQLIDAPYVVMEQVHGTEPTEVPAGLAEQLARLHQIEQPGPAALPEVEEDGWGDPWRTIEDLADRGFIDPGTATWLSGWFTRLAERVDAGGPKVLIHGDVAAHNLLAGPGNDLRALIDWGDAAWAPPAMDFAKLPLTQVAALLPAYQHHLRSPAATRRTSPTVHTAASASARTAGSSDSEHELAAAILWFHLSWALAKLPAAPWPNQRHWTAPTTSRLLGLLQFFTTTPPAPWGDLV